MRRRLITLALVAGLSGGGLFLGAPAQAAPPGPQCTSIRNCDPLPTQVVQKIIETCQKAYCQL